MSLKYEPASVPQHSPLRAKQTSAVHASLELDMCRTLGRQRGNSFRLCQTVPISDSIFSARCPCIITRGPPPSSFLKMELLELELVLVSGVAK